MDKLKYLLNHPILTCVFSKNQTSMSVHLGQVVVLNYATIPLEVTFALVTLDTFSVQTIVDAMVRVKIMFCVSLSFMYSFTHDIQISMSVYLEQVVVVNYATTPLEATFALVTLDTFFMLKIVHAMVCCTSVIT